jgi:protein PsiE
MLKKRPLQSSLIILSWIEYLILIIVTLATITAVAHEALSLILEGKVHISDLLLLFIYLEVISMVAVYLESGQVPVRMPLYIAMVALARYLILDMKNLDSWTMVAISGAILLIAIAVLVVRYGHVKYPYESSSGHGDKH